MEACINANIHEHKYTPAPISMAISKDAKCIPSLSASFEICVATG